MEKYPELLDDELTDAFEDWIGDMDAMDVVAWAEEWGQTVREEKDKEIANKQILLDDVCEKAVEAEKSNASLRGQVKLLKTQLAKCREEH
jgi:hypothetical protein